MMSLRATGENGDAILFWADGGSDGINEVEEKIHGCTGGGIMDFEFLQTAGKQFQDAAATNQSLQTKLLVKPHGETGEL